jgi:hypothetical protein
MNIETYQMLTVIFAGAGLLVGIAVLIVDEVSKSA